MEIALKHEETSRTAWLDFSNTYHHLEAHMFCWCLCKVGLTSIIDRVIFYFTTAVGMEPGGLKSSPSLSADEEKTERRKRSPPSNNLSQGLKESLSSSFRVGVAKSLFTASVFLHLFLDSKYFKNPTKNLIY